MISTTKTLYELMPQVNYLENTTTSLSILNLLPLLSIIFIYFFCLGYVTKTETNPFDLLPKVLLLSLWVILSLTGLRAHPGHMMENGMDHSIFRKFKKVFSGHYHMKSNRDNVYYLGNPYQLYWNDYGCKRGFHVFDTDTLKTTFYRNPFNTFHKLYYNGSLVYPTSQNSKDPCQTNCRRERRLCKV